MWHQCMRKLLVLLPLPLLLLGLAVACGDDDEAENAPTASAGAATTAAATPTAKPETLKIGINMELSGQYAVAIQPYLDGIQMAADDINAEGGLQAGGKRYEIALVIKDNQLDPNVAVANTTGLIRDEGVKFIFGPVSELFLAPYEIMKQNKVWGATQAIGIQGELSAKPITDNPYVFISGSKYDDVFGAGAKVLRSLVPESQGKKVAILNEDTPSGALFAEVLKGAAEAAGFDVVADEKYASQGADFNTLMTKVKSSNPDFIWASTVINAIQLLKAAEELQVAKYYMTTVIDPQIPNAAAIGGPLAHPLYMVNNAPWFGSLASSPQRKAFGDRATASAGGPIPIAFEFTFTAGYYTMHLLADAMAEAGTVEDVAAVSEAMEGLSFDGPVGPGTIEGHFLTLPMEMAEFKDGTVAQVCYYADLKDITKKECAVPEQ